MHTKAKFLYLCARITNTRRYETHHYGAGAENLQGVLPDDGRMMLYSFAWIGCIMPADGTGGGATGLSRVLCHAVEHWPA